jgi:hypothetical protein
VLFPNSKQTVPVLPVLRLLLSLAIIFTGCSFINLTPIGFSTYPGDTNTILAGENTALCVYFDTAMDQLATQKILSVQTAGGTVQGETSWQGDVLQFTPLEPWLPGVRHTLSLEGTIRARDGREEQVSHFVT